MDIIVVFNGLGNQMSQYAFYLAKKKNNSNCHVVFDPKSSNQHNGLELEAVFGIKFNNSKLEEVLRFFYGYILNRRIINRLFKVLGIRMVNEPKNYDFQEYLLTFHAKGINFYCGGWHSEKYYTEIRQELKEKFKFKLVGNSFKFNEWLKKIQFDDNSVSIHVRRGDYLDKPSDSFYQFGGVCTVDYYKKSIEYFKAQNLLSNFYVFSNDIDWCIDTFGTVNMYFVDCNKDIDSWKDMYLMSECRHHINANSTFSWWAAWLSPHSSGVTIRPQFFINNIETKDFYPQEWLMIK